LSLKRIITVKGQELRS